MFWELEPKAVKKVISKASVPGRIVQRYWTNEMR